MILNNKTINFNFLMLNRKILETNEFIKKLKNLSLCIIKTFKSSFREYYIMEIKDNELLRQFETQTDEGLLVIEYALQERKIFLTKLNPPENLENEIVDDFIKEVLSIASERKLKVVPTNPKLAKFFRKNPIYKELLPPGIKI